MVPNTLTKSICQLGGQLFILLENIVTTGATTAVVMRVSDLVRALGRVNTVVGASIFCSRCTVQAVPDLLLDDSI